MYKFLPGAVLRCPAREVGRRRAGAPHKPTLYYQSFVVYVSRLHYKIFPAIYGVVLDQSTGTEIPFG